MPSLELEHKVLQASGSPTSFTVRRAQFRLGSRMRCSKPKDTKPSRPFCRRAMLVLSGCICKPSRSSMTGTGRRRGPAGSGHSAYHSDVLPISYYKPTSQGLEVRRAWVVRPWTLINNQMEQPVLLRLVAPGLYTRSWMTSSALELVDQVIMTIVFPLPAMDSGAVEVAPFR